MDICRRQAHQGWLAGLLVLAMVGCQGETAPSGSNPGSAGTTNPPANSGLPCATFYSSTFRLATGMDNSPRPAAGSKPAKGVEFADPLYGTCLLRATDHATEEPSGFARTDYARRQAFNADNTRMLIAAYDGYWHLYDANTLAWIKRLKGPAGDAEPQWHATDPNQFYYLPTHGGLVIYRYDIATDVSTVAANFTGRLPWPNVAHLWTHAEGSPSANGRYWALGAEAADWSGLGLVSYDMQTDTILGTWDFAAHGLGKADPVTMSPSGEYVVAGWDGTGYGVTAFSRDFSSQIKVAAKPNHADLALLPNGHDAYVAVDYNTAAGDVFMVELQTGVRTVLFTSYISGTTSAFHFSGKAFDKPGWVLVSAQAAGIDAGESIQWLHNKLFAVELKANPQIRPLALHQSYYKGYWTAPLATVNRDFTRVLFNSNWGVDTTTDVDAYQMVLPPAALD